MNETLFDLQHFIDKFSKVELITGILTHGVTGLHCALGECNSTTDSYYELANKEAKALVDLLWNNIDPKSRIGLQVDEWKSRESNQFDKIWIVPLINDDYNQKYAKGATPKDRILNVLNKIKNNEKI